jgi:hypothetical protein
LNALRVQADEQPAICHDSVGIRPDLANFGLFEAERLVERQRFADLGCEDADFEKAADQ